MSSPFQKQFSAKSPLSQQEEIKKEVKKEVKEEVKENNCESSWAIAKKQHAANKASRISWAQEKKQHKCDKSTGYKLKPVETFD
tara:strand:- start:65 stop:316 length:252 start_codon:yes stop_codon:yes gene_type:complete